MTVFVFPPLTAAATDRDEQEGADTPEDELCASSTRAERTDRHPQAGWLLLRCETAAVSEPGRIWAKGDSFPHSVSTINRVGERIRRAVETNAPIAGQDLAFLDLYRSCHYPGLRELQERLRRYFYKELELDPESWVLTTRPLKTPQAIIAKLVREKTRLSRVQDIAGARIVVPSLEAQELIGGAIVGRFPGLEPRVAKDSRFDPDATGYRALHIVVKTRQHGAGARFAEIQIRTTVQEAWAQIVEALDAGFSWDLKHGRGPAEAEKWSQWLLEMSEAGASADRGEEVRLPKPPGITEDV